MKCIRFFAAVVLLFASTSFLLLAQVKTEVPPPEPTAKPIRADKIRIHSAAVEGNLEGNSADRDAIVLLPSSYDAQKTRRYPVLYALHGYSIGAEQWSHEIHVPQTIEGAFAKGAQDMIVVLPDSKTIHNGSMYSSSVTTVTLRNSSPAMSSLTSTLTTAPYPCAAAVDLQVTRWVDMARVGSA